MSELNAAEQLFFATGELPPELATQAAEEPAPVEQPAQPAVADDLEQRLAAERQRAAQLEATIHQLAQRVGPQPQAAPEPAPPDVTQDPLGAMLHQLNAVTRTVATLQDTLTSQQQAAQQQTQMSEFTAKLHQTRDEFTKTTPDFASAYQHLRAARAADLADVGVPQAQIAQALLQDEIAISQNALSQGKNPAQVIYNMAKRYGYAARAADPAGKIAAVKSGIATDVAPASGGRETALTLEGLKNAGDTDLTKMVLDDAQWNRIVGGRSNSIF